MTIRVNLGAKPPAPPQRRVQRGVIDVQTMSEQIIANVNMSNAVLHISTIDMMIREGTSGGGIANLTAGGHIESANKLKFQRSSSAMSGRPGEIVRVYWQVEDYI